MDLLQVAATAYFVVAWTVSLKVEMTAYGTVDSKVVCLE
jgi:hypothetical protein